MRFPFRALPAAGGGELTPRPVVDIALEGLPAAPIECLLDTGALRTRMSAELAPLAGIELADTLTEEFFVAGLRTVGTFARVNLTGQKNIHGMRRSGFVIHGRMHSAWLGLRASCSTSL